MANQKVKVITVQEAKKQMNCFGYPLAIFFSIFIGLRYLLQFMDDFFVQFQYDKVLVILVVSYITTLFFTGIIVILAKHKLSLNFKDYWTKPKVSKKKVLNYIFLGIGIMLLTNAIMSMFSFLTIPNVQRYSFLGNFDTKENIINNCLFFFFFVLIKPMCDEIIFRGIVQRQLGHYGRYFGVLASSFLFAILQGNLIEAIPAFFIGWYFALIALKYHSIRINLAISSTIYFFDWIIDILPDSMLLVTTLFVIVIYIVCIIILLNHQINTKIIRYGATDPKLWKIYLTTPSILLCIILFFISSIFFVLQ